MFTSGQTPARDGVLTISGKLGRDVSIEDGQQAPVEISLVVEV
ncbi:hypothetical protein [Arthrobacter sp. 35/47]|nr:hypothetical protein [Arthrobacter sp. 35/47]